MRTLGVASREARESLRRRQQAGGSAVVVKCPSCEQQFALPDGVTSGEGKCPHCAVAIDVAQLVRGAGLGPGSVLGGCRIEGVLGRGGMAVVYKATQLSLERPVALKVLAKRFARSAHFVERFAREATALARLAHPNIVGILDKGAEGDTYYFVMECVEGESLADRLIRETKIPPEETLRLVHGICDALAYAHDNGIVHRDLKPGNVLLDASGSPKLVDFGIARMLGTEGQPVHQLTTARMVMGSGDYMAPEQRGSAAAADHRADIYALGVLLYQMLTGLLPVGTVKPASQLVRGVPLGVDRVIRTALANLPADRFESVARFREALDRAFATAAATRVAQRAPGPARRRSSSSVGLTVTLVALGLVAAIGLVIVLGRSGPAPPPPEPPPPAFVAPPVAPRDTRPQPKVEPPAPQDELTEVRRFMAANPNDFEEAMRRLKALASSSQSELSSAASRELGDLVARFDRAVNEHFDRTRRRAEDLFGSRQFAAAIDIAGHLPENLSTADSKARRQQMVDDYRRRARDAFAVDRDRVTAFLDVGKPDDAAALLRSVDYGLTDLNSEAAALRKKIQEATATAKAKPKAPIELTAELKALWAKREFPEAHALIKDALAQAPDDAYRETLRPQAYAAKLLDTFWTRVLVGARSRIGLTFLIEGRKYDVLGLDGCELRLELRGIESTRSVKTLNPDSLYSFAINQINKKRAEDLLMLALLNTYDKRPNAELARTIFAEALDRGASRSLVNALSDLSAAARMAEGTPPSK